MNQEFTSASVISLLVLLSAFFWLDLNTVDLRAEEAVTSVSGSWRERKKLSVNRYFICWSWCQEVPLGGRGTADGVFCSFLFFRQRASGARVVRKLRKRGFT